MIKEDFVKGVNSRKSTPNQLGAWLDKIFGHVNPRFGLGMAKDVMIRYSGDASAFWKMLSPAEKGKITKYGK